MDHIFLTYEEAGKRLGIKSDSVRRRARSRKWPRRSGNDGLTQVGVPSELLTPEPSHGSPGGPLPGHITDNETVELRAENRFLKEKVEDLKEDRDRWRTQAEQLSKPRSGLIERIADRLFRNNT